MSELAEEQELRDLFERFGRVTRVFLARDRDTQRAKGFAFISFADRSDAARACEKMDGCKLSSRYTMLLFTNGIVSRLSPSHFACGIRQENFIKVYFASLTFYKIPFSSCIGPYAVRLVSFEWVETGMLADDLFSSRFYMKKFMYVGNAQ